MPIKYLQHGADQTPPRPTLPYVQASISGVTAGPQSTITTYKPHGFYASGELTVAGVTGIDGVNGVWPVTGIPSPTTIIIANGATAGAYQGGGCASIIAPPGTLITLADGRTVMGSQ